MKSVFIVTNNDVFVDVLSADISDFDLKCWAKNYIMHNDNDVEFWDRGQININPKSIVFSRDNGFFTLDLKKILVKDKF